MPHSFSSDAPILIVEPDPELRTALVDGLTADGMTVAACGSAAQALERLGLGLVPAVLVIPAAPGIEESPLVINSRLRWPRLEVVFTGRACATINLRGAHHLPAPFDADKLSRFLRLVVARPALRSTLQSRYRLARPAPSNRGTAVVRRA
jgi:DNA-binding response OmpR family regulator